LDLLLTADNSNTNWWAQREGKSHRTWSDAFASHFDLSECDKNWRECSLWAMVDGGWLI